MSLGGRESGSGAQPRFVTTRPGLGFIESFLCRVPLILFCSRLENYGINSSSEPKIFLETVIKARRAHCVNQSVLSVLISLSKRGDGGFGKVFPPAFGPVVFDSVSDSCHRQ